MSGAGLHSCALSQPLFRALHTYLGGASAEVWVYSRLWHCPHTAISVSMYAQFERRPTPGVFQGSVPASGPHASGGPTSPHTGAQDLRPCR